MQESTDTSSATQTVCLFGIDRRKLEMIWGRHPNPERYEWCKKSATVVDITGCIHEHISYHVLCDEHSASEVHAGDITCGRCLGYGDGSSIPIDLRHECNTKVWKVVTLNEYNSSDEMRSLREKDGRRSGNDELDRSASGDSSS